MEIITRQSVLLGIASWLVPFAVSIVFFDQSGQLTIPQPLFKSIMVVVGGGVGTWLLLQAFSQFKPSARSGFLIGCLWLAINWTLDIAILVPMGKMTIAGYFSDIGLRYLLLPVIATAMGIMADRVRA